MNDINSKEEKCKVAISKKKYQESQTRPAVGFRLVTEFNECVAMDLKNVLLWICFSQ